ncbi:MAG: hypothetical protein ABR972_05050 [Acidimicrobiales bacterium]|jgi:hypothetical protein
MNVRPTPGNLQYGRLDGMLVKERRALTGREPADVLDLGPGGRVPAPG